MNKLNGGLNKYVIQIITEHLFALINCAKCGSEACLIMHNPSKWFHSFFKPVPKMVHFHRAKFDACSHYDKHPIWYKNQPPLKLKSPRQGPKEFFQCWGKIVKGGLQGAGGVIACYNLAKALKKTLIITISEIQRGSHPIAPPPQWSYFTQKANIFKIFLCLLVKF